jgi:hypothetical protein
MHKHRRNIIFFQIFSILGYPTILVSSVVEDLPVGGRAIGMGSAYVAVALGPESVFFNPAGLSQARGPALTLFISHPYGLRELTHETLSAVVPTRYGSFGLSLQTFGHTLYRENTLAIGWGNPYREKVHYGILIRALQLQIQKYGSDAVLTLDIGCLLRLTDKITCGIAATNLNRGGIGRQNESLPQITRIGISYTPCPGLLFSAEIDKDPRFPAELKGGVEIRPLSNLSFRCGFGREPSYVAAGIGLAWDIFLCDYGFTSHPVLGATHQGSISIDLNPPRRKAFQPIH